MLSSSIRADTSSILLFSAVSLSTYFLIKVLKGASNRNGLPLPPSLPSVPMLGSFPFMGSLNKLPDTLREISHRLGAVFSIKVGSQYVVVLNTRAVIYEALLRKSAAFSGRLMGYTIVGYLNPHQYGIIHKQYGPEFRKLHQVTLNILKEFGFGSRMMQERILEEIEELLHLIEQQNSEAFNPCHVFAICTLNVISSIVFGKRLSQTHPALEELEQNFREMIQDKRRQVDICPALRYLPSYQSIIAGSIANQAQHMKFITDRLEESLETERDSFVKRFVEFWGKDSCDMNELKFIIRDLLIAGSETTSTTAQFAMLRMANHLDVQERMQAEIDSVVGRGRTVTLEDLGKMPYVEAVLMEVQRIHTVVPLALPHCTLEDAELGGYFIPKGTIVYPNIKSAHMDPNIWQDPKTFSPDRFLDSEGRVKRRELLITFSIGKRSCLGELLARQEIFLIITNLVHKFTILPPEGHKNVIIEENFLVTSFPSPYQIRFQSRV